MSPVINRLAVVLLATGSSIAIAAAGSPSQGPAPVVDHGSAVAAKAQSVSHVAPVAFWLGLEPGGTTAPQASGPADAAPATRVPTRPRSETAPAASHVPPLAMPVAQHIPPLPSAETAQHVPPLPATAAGEHVPPMPVPADAVHVPPLAPAPARAEPAAVRQPRSEVLKPLAITYVVPGPLPAEAAEPSQSSNPSPQPRAQTHSHEHVAAAPLPLPPPPAPRSRIAASTPRAVIHVADETKSVKAPGVTKLGTPSTTAATTVKPAETTSPAKEPPVKTLKVGVGGGILVRLPRPAATVFAADPKVARVEAASPTAIFVIGMEAGSTNLIATNAAGEPIAQYVVTVGGKVTAPKTKTEHVARYKGPPRHYVPSYTTWGSRRIQEAVNNVVPGANLVKIKKVGDAYILTGVVATPEIAQEVEAIAKAYGATNLMDKMEVLSSIQVNVRVRVADVSRTMIHQLGLNWSVLGKTGNFQIGMFGPGAGPSSITNTVSGETTTTLGTSLTDLFAASGAGTAYQAGVGYASGNWNLNTVLNALATNSLATILAEPNLTVESGHTANFLSGGQYPIPEPSSGSNTIGITYKNYGVSLSVTPTVIAPDKISLTVTPTVSQLDYAHAVDIAGTAVPALTMQKASTVVQLGSGQAFAIAGLLKSSTSQTAEGLPGAEGIPVLGALFRNNDFNRDSEELVIIVTPYLVNPVSNPGKLHAPTDNFVPATTLQQILFGKQMQGNQTAPKSTPPLDAGFLME